MRSGRAAGVVAANPAVREALIDLQRTCRCPPRRAWCCADGRTSVVIARADYKFFIDAYWGRRSASKGLQEKGSVYLRVLQDMKNVIRDRTRASALWHPRELSSIRQI